MSSIIGFTYVANAYKQCFNVLVPDLKKWDAQYTQQHQDEFAHCIARYVDSFKATQSAFFQKND